VEEESFVVGGQTLLTIGGLLGALTGIISWLLRKLLRSKDDQVAEAKAQVEHMEHDRDYWRDLAMRLMSERGDPTRSR
jgi:hypothetical protein